MTTIEILSELRGNYNCFDEQEEPVYRALSEAIKAVFAQPEPQWIPCECKLPEEKGEYLVTYHPCYWDNVQADVKVGIDSFRGKTTWAKKKHQRVVAWMPLPEPYEEEKDEQMGSHTDNT